MSDARSGEAASGQAGGTVPLTPQDLVEVKVQVPVEDLASFYGAVASWYQEKDIPPVEGRINVG